MLEPTQEVLYAIGLAMEKEIKRQRPRLTVPIANAFITGLTMGCYIGMQDPQEARNFLAASTLPPKQQRALYEWVVDHCS